MFFVRLQPPEPLPLGKKILIALSVVTALILMFFFAFTFFLVALIGGGFLFILRTLSGNRQSGGDRKTDPIIFHKRGPRQDNDDVIDI